MRHVQINHFERDKEVQGGQCKLVSHTLILWEQADELNRKWPESGLRGLREIEPKQCPYITSCMVDIVFSERMSPHLVVVYRVRWTATVVWFPLTSWKKCLMMWRCIWPILRPTTPRKSLPTGPLPTLPQTSQRANGYIIIAALSARPCVHPSFVLSLDFRLSLPPLCRLCAVHCVCLSMWWQWWLYTN